MFFFSSTSFYTSVVVGIGMTMLALRYLYRGGLRRLIGLPVREMARIVLLLSIICVFSATAFQEIGAFYNIYNQKSTQYHAARRMGAFCAMNEDAPERHMEPLRQQCDIANITIHSSVMLESLIALTMRWPSLGVMFGFETFTSRALYVAIGIGALLFFYQPSEYALRKYFNNRRRRYEENMANIIAGAMYSHGGQTPHQRLVAHNAAVAAAVARHKSTSVAAASPSSQSM